MSGALFASSAEGAAGFPLWLGCVALFAEFFPLMGGVVALVCRSGVLTRGRAEEAAGEEMQAQQTMDE